MVQKSEVDDTSKKFLMQMYRQVNADVSLKASMYDIGSEAGLEKDDAL